MKIIKIILTVPAVFLIAGFLCMAAFFSLAGLAMDLLVVSLTDSADVLLEFLSPGGLKKIGDRK